MTIKRIKELVQALSEFEKSVPLLDRSRSKALEQIRDGADVPAALSSLEGLQDMRREMREALESLELALKNSAATFARFEQKAAKDEVTIAAARKTLGAPAFDDKSPILVAQRQAYQRAAQKLDFLMSELDKLRGTLSSKYKLSTGFKELAALKKALETDQDNWGNDATLQSAYRVLTYGADSHRLDR
jgi:hypothetical protein